MHLAVQANDTYKEEFIKAHNIKSQQDLNNYIKKHKPINIGLFINKAKKGQS